MRKPTVKAGELRVYYGKLSRYDSNDVIYHSGDGVPRCDRALLHHRLGCDHPPAFPGGEWGKSLIDELEARGYDLSTLRFSVKKKPTTPEDADDA